MVSIIVLAATVFFSVLGIAQTGALLPMAAVGLTAFLVMNVLETH
jgi:hypothetical protein